MPAALIGGLVAGVGSLAGGGLQALGASSAANAETSAANTAAQTQLTMFNQIQKNLSPFLSAGQGGLTNLLQTLNSSTPQYGQNAQTINSLGALLGPGATSGALTGANGGQNLNNILQTYPGYQFALQQGGNALNQANAARGLLTSGAQVKDAQAYGQGLASQQFQNYSNQFQNYTTTALGQSNQNINQLANLSNLGETAGAGIGNAGLTTGQGIANSQLLGGQAAASGIIGQTNAATNGLAGLTNNSALMNSLLNYNQLSNGGNGGYSGAIAGGYGAPGSISAY